MNKDTEPPPGTSTLLATVFRVPTIEVEGVQLTELESEKLSTMFKENIGSGLVRAVYETSIVP
jgi:hypothetical protein